MKTERIIYQVEYNGRSFPLLVFTLRDVKTRVKVKVSARKKKVVY